MKHNRELWEEIVEKGRENQSDETANVLDLGDINTILATLDFFGATPVFLRQAMFDLHGVHYRVFDWIAMCIMGRNDDDRQTNNTGLKVLVHAFREAGYDEKKFIENLRQHDYQVETEWEDVDIDGEDAA